jgi:hypothetical protein
VTVACGITAPLVSVTVPVKSPEVTDCAEIYNPESDTTNKASASKVLILAILITFLRRFVVLTKGVSA